MSDIVMWKSDEERKEAYARGERSAFWQSVFLFLILVIWIGSGLALLVSGVIGAMMGD